MEPTREEALTREILAMYEEYVRAFLSDDMDTINRLSLFPIAFIADDRVVTMDEYPVKRAELRAKTGWADTCDMYAEMVGLDRSEGPPHEESPRSRLCAAPPSGPRRLRLAAPGEARHDRRPGAGKWGIPDQDYGTWARDDLMPAPRPVNIAVFLDAVMEFNGPLMFVPGSHR
jgi:hypothetical protein